MDTPKRALVKAISWRAIAIMITLIVTFIITDGHLAITLQVGLLDTLVRIIAYYGHERAWNRVSFGRAKSPDV